MNNDDLLALLDDLESDRAERKQSISDQNKIRQAICAFANDLPDYKLPGVLFVGANDDGSPTGLEVTDRLLQTIASMRDDGNILPLPSLVVQKKCLKGGEMVIVIVQPSEAPPVRLKGTIWIRSGPRRGIASRDDERCLSEKRRHRDLPADIRPNSSASVEDLDELLFRRTYLPSAISPDILEQNERSLEHQLAATKFLHLDSPPRPTTLGILAVGKSPRDWIPGAYIQFLRIDGKELGDPVKDAREISGPLSDMLNEIEEVTRANIQNAVEIESGPREIRHADYPIVAIQQVVRNAVLHRTYENTNAPVRVYWFNDRIEIQNPGGPFGQVNCENFGESGVCDYRNPNLAAVMKEMGYVQRFGFGIALSRRAMKENGNPLPEFQVELAHVAVILRRNL